MKVKFNSVVVAGSWAVSNTMSQVSYDMSSVRLHECDLPVRTNPMFLFYFPFQSCGCSIGFGILFFMIGAAGALIAERMDMAPGTMMRERLLTIAACLIPLFGLIGGWFTATGKTLEHLMEQAARTERGLPDTARIKVVMEKDWPAFVARLKDS